VIASGEAVRDTSGDILRLCGTVEDITEHELPIVRDERELESLRNVNYGIGRLIRAQEEEHTRIAQELRDNICQKLCLLTLEIQGLTPDFPELPPPARVRLEELGLYTTEIVTEIVQFSHRLHPSTLDLLGLPPAIQGLCREFARRNSIPVECSCTDVVP
jgi:signal transduction histidine kinase